MVFNSNGKTYLNQFTYNNVDLETVANYCYLGMVLKFNGNFNLASINTLRERPFNLKGGGGGGGLWFFSKKNIMIPNVAEKKYSDFDGGKKNNLIQSFCQIT